MSKDNRDNRQRALAQFYANERKRLGGSFLVALYNLRLPKERLSQENKKRLAYIVWLFFEFPQTNLYEPPADGNDRPPGFLFFKNGFSIEPEMIGYAEPDEKGMNRPGTEAWWNSDDFDAFQRNYQHLCGLVDSCIEGKNYWNFRRDDLEWLHEKMSRLVHFSVQLHLKRPVFMVVSETPGTMRPARPDEIPPDIRLPFIPLSSTGESSTGNPPAGCVWCYLDLPRTGGAWLYEQSEDGTISFNQFSPVIVPEIERDMPPSDLILHRAYLELIDIINNHGKFGRCKAEATLRRPACPNIFLRKKQRGPTKRWCSDSCRRRMYEAQQARNRTKKGRK